MESVSLAVYQQVNALRIACNEARKVSKRVALVPTMGALHDGHFALVREARRHADFVVVSIFVNPTQFGPNEDYSSYPRTFEKDSDGCARAGAAAIFAPQPIEMYPIGELTRVQVPGLSEPLCGGFRPGHFEGVATVVAKLFAICGDCTAVFGRKDYQQLQVIKRMANDLMLPVTIVGFPTVRESDGLAMSSRNAYLGADDRIKARQIPLALSDAVRAFQQGERSVARLRAAVIRRVETVASSIDYIALADADTLRPFEDSAEIGERAVIALAARVGPARLIDNVVLGEDDAPCGEELR